MEIPTPVIEWGMAIAIGIGGFTAKYFLSKQKEMDNRIAMLERTTLTKTDFAPFRQEVVDVMRRVEDKMDTSIRELRQTQQNIEKDLAVVEHTIDFASRPAYQPTDRKNR